MNDDFLKKEAENKKNLISEVKKTKQWKAKDFARTIALFGAHTIVIIVGFFLILLNNVGFNFSAAIDFIKNEKSVGSLVYLFFAVCLVAVAMYLYFYYEKPKFAQQTKNVNLIFVALEVSTFVSYIVGKYNVYARPFALCSLLILLLVDKRTAIFMNAVGCLLMFTIDAFLSVIPLESHIHSIYSSFIIGFSTNIIAIYLVDGISSRLRVFLMGFVISIPIIISCICLEFSSFLKAPIFFVVCGFTSGMLSVVLMMAILPVFERVFNVVTDYRLSELTDHKSKLIKILKENASGTFYHSFSVSTLAEACAIAIGENALLARACAYYHDIGKLKAPNYFAENQGDYNPHNEITPELSRDIIRSHAKDGYDLLLKYHLPQEIADVARQHHGTLPIKYFYVQASKFTEDSLSINDFCYLGPKPQSKIAAIIMIVDGCEAKVRSIEKRNPDSVDEAVRDIIEERIRFDQFSECELTMKDIDIIRRTITESFTNMYHGRVVYPKLKIGLNRNKRNK